MGSQESTTFDPRGFTNTQTTPVVTPTAKSEYDLFEVVRLVERLPRDYYDDRNKWFRVGAVLHNLFPTTGLEIYKRFSRQSDKYKTGDCEDLWPQFGSYDGNRPGLSSLREWVGGERQGIQFAPLSEYMAQDFRADYWVPGILAKNQPMIAGGAPKVFKTSLIMNMCLAIASGGMFLGQSCAKGSVAFVSGESGDAANQSMIRRQLNGAVPDNFFITSQIPRFDRPLDEWENALGELGVDILVVDPLYLAMDGSDAGNVFQMGKQLKNVADLASRLGVTLILVHHCTKSAAREHKPLSTNDLSWAGSAEFARQWFLLSHRRPYQDGRAQLHLNAGGSAGHSSLLQLDVNEGVAPNRIWDVSVKTNREAIRDREEERFQDVVKKVREVVTEAMCKTPIRDAVGIRSKDSGFFPRLLEEGVLVESGKKGGNPLYKVA